MIKIRLDLLKAVENGSNLSQEDQYIDYYDNLINLEAGQSVCMGYPFQSINSNKLIYVMQQDLSD